MRPLPGSVKISAIWYALNHLHSVDVEALMIEVFLRFHTRLQKSWRSLSWAF